MTLQLGVKVVVDAKDLTSLGETGAQAMGKIDAAATKAEVSVNQVSDAAKDLAGLGDTGAAAMGKIDAAAKKAEISVSEIADAAKDLTSTGNAGAQAMSKIETAAKKAEQSVNKVADAAKRAGTLPAAPAPVRPAPPIPSRPITPPTPANNNRPNPHGESDTAGLNRIQALMLGHSAKATIETLAAGGSPMQVLLQQGPEVLQALQMGSGGPLQTLKALGSSIAGLLSPAVLATGALGGLTAALVYAGVSYASEQKDIARRLSSGVTRGSGATPGLINAVGNQDFGGALSQSQARGLAMGFAGTGVISGNMIGNLTSLVPGLAALMGGDMEAAGQRMAQAFADPTKGAEDLEKALGPLDDKTKQLIRSMQASGDLAGAQRALYQAVAEGAKNAAEQVGFFSRVINGVSNDLDRLGHAISKPFTGGTLQEQLGDAQMKYIEMEKQLSDSKAAPESPLAGILDRQNEDLKQRVDAQLAEVNRLQAAVDKEKAVAAQAKKDAEDKASSQQAGGYVRSVLPDIQRLQDLRDMLASLNKAAASPEILGRMGVTAEQNRQAIDAVTGALQSYMTAEEKARASEKLTIDSINARTVAEKAAVAVQRERLALEGQKVSPEEQSRKLAAAAAAVQAQSNRDSIDQLKSANDNAALAGLPEYRRQLAAIEQKYREQLKNAQGADPATLANIRGARDAEVYAAQQAAIGNPIRDANRSLQEQVAALKLQQDAFGKSAGEAAKLAAAQELINRYNAAGVPITDTLRGAIEAYATKIGAVAQKSYDLAQKQNQVIASLDQVRDTSRNVLGGLASDLMHGASAADALANAAGKIGDQLISNATNNITEGLFGQNGKAGGGMFGDVLGGIFGRQVGLTSADITAGIVNVNGSVAGDLTKVLGGGFNPATPSTIAGGGAALNGVGPTEVIKSSPLPDVGSAAASTLSSIGSGGGSFSTAGRYQGGVNAQLTDILRSAAERSGLQIQAISGLRPGDPRFHGKGLATDVSIIDPATGRALPNYQNGAAFRQYEQFAQTARQVQMERYPELADRFRWGGYFSGPKGKYGAADLMHFDLGGGRVGMGGGSWANGLNAGQRALFPDAVSVGMGTGQQIPGLQQLQQNLSQLGTAAQSAAPSLTNVLAGMTGLPAPLASVATNATQAGNAIGQGGGGLVGALQALLSGIFGGGSGVGAHADGGQITGPGTSRSDSIITRVSHGEFIVNASATAKNLPLLHAINSNRMPAFADGGAADLGSPASAGAWRGMNDSRPAAGGGVTMNVYNQSGAEIEQKSSRDDKGREQLDLYISEKMATDIRRPGTKPGRAMQAQYGLKPQVTRR